jgi:hypothetical protein
MREMTFTTWTTRTKSVRKSMTSLLSVSGAEAIAFAIEISKTCVSVKRDFSMRKVKEG